MNSRYKRKALPNIAISPVVIGMGTPVINALLCATDYGILMTDVKGNDILCNPLFGELFDVDPEEIVHSTRDEVRRMALSRVVDPVEFNNLIESIYADPTIERSDEIELRTSPPRILARYTAPVYDLHGNNIGRLWTFSDVTETRRLQSEVRFYAAELERQLERQKREYEITAETLRVLTEINNVVATVSDRREVAFRLRFSARVAPR